MTVLHRSFGLCGEFKPTLPKYDEHKPRSRQPGPSTSEDSCLTVLRMALSMGLGVCSVWGCVHLELMLCQVHGTLASAVQMVPIWLPRPAQDSHLGYSSRRWTTPPRSFVCEDVDRNWVSGPSYVHIPTCELVLVLIESDRKRKGLDQQPPLTLIPQALKSWRKAYLWRVGRPQLTSYVVQFEDKALPIIQEMLWASLPWELTMNLFLKWHGNEAARKIRL